MALALIVSVCVRPIRGDDDRDRAVYEALHQGGLQASKDAQERYPFSGLRAGDNEANRRYLESRRTVYEASKAVSREKIARKFGMTLAEVEAIQRRGDTEKWPVSDDPRSRPPIDRPREGLNSPAAPTKLATPLPTPDANGHPLRPGDEVLMGNSHGPKVVGATYRGRRIYVDNPTRAILTGKTEPTQVPEVVFYEVEIREGEHAGKRAIAFPGALRFVAHRGDPGGLRFNWQRFGTILFIVACVGIALGIYGRDWLKPKRPEPKWYEDPEGYRRWAGR
jgi:hypothetical protein